MAPRQRSVSTDFLSRARKQLEAHGRVGLGGMNSVGAASRARGGGGLSVLTNAGAEGGESTGAAQLLVLSATNDSIASGGDYVTFDAVVAQHGFDGVVATSGGYWVHPVSGVYVLTYEHEWASYNGGGRVQVEVDGELIPEGDFGSADSGSDGQGTLMYYAAAGSIARIKVTHSAAAAQLCDAVARIAISDPAESISWEFIETVWVDSRVHASSGAAVSSSSTLGDGLTYRLTVTGNAGLQTDDSMDLGSPDTTLYPSPGLSADNVAMLDADTAYAWSSEFGTAPDDLPSHSERLKFDVGSGFAHIEPDDGARTSPSSGHSYSFTVTGEGSALSAYLLDAGDLSDNNGQLKVEIYRRVVF